MPNTQRKRIITGVPIQNGGTHTTAWQDVGNRTTGVPRGLLFRFSADGADQPKATLTLRYSMFTPTDPVHPAGQSGNYVDVVLGTGLVKNSFYHFYPAALAHPIQCYAMKVEISDANATNVNAWEIALSDQSPGLHMEDLGVGKIQVTIPNGQHSSDVAHIPGTLVGLRSPQMSASTAWFKALVSDDNINFADLYDGEGNLVVLHCSASAARTIYIPPTIFAGFRYVRLSALQSDKATPQPQSGAKTISLYYRNI